MVTKKLLVAFDPKKPDAKSSDFLAVVLDGATPSFLGLKTGKSPDQGVVIFLGKEIRANDLFAKLIDSGRKFENVSRTICHLEAYIEQLQSFQIGNVVSIQPDGSKNFQLVKVADMPSIKRAKRLP